jgi:hypothetical protein
MDEPTPWEEINPRTALAPRREPPLPSLDRLKPASTEQFRNELTACLALTAPAGMTEEGRREWLAVAWETLKHLPPDILSIGCRKARESCDHPSKIVPTIMAETAEAMSARRSGGYYAPSLPSPPVKKHVMDRRGEPMSEEETAELNGILEKLKAGARYRPDGSRYFIEV